MSLHSGERQTDESSGPSVPSSSFDLCYQEGIICRDIGRETFAFRFDFWRRRAGFAYKGVKEGPTFALTLGSSSGYFGKVVWGRDRMEDVNLN